MYVVTVGRVSPRHFGDRNLRDLCDFVSHGKVAERAETEQQGNVVSLYAGTPQMRGADVEENGYTASGSDSKRGGRRRGPRAEVGSKKQNDVVRNRFQCKLLNQLCPTAVRKLSV